MVSIVGGGVGGCDDSVIIETSIIHYLITPPFLDYLHPDSSSCSESDSCFHFILLSNALHHLPLGFLFCYLSSRHYPKTHIHISVESTSVKDGNPLFITPFLHFDGKSDLFNTLIGSSIDLGDVSFLENKYVKVLDSKYIDAGVGWGRCASQSCSSMKEGRGLGKGPEQDNSKDFSKWSLNLFFFSNLMESVEVVMLVRRSSQNWCMYTLGTSQDDKCQDRQGVSIMRMLRLKEVARKTVRKSFIYAFSDSLLLTPLCCEDIHDVTPRVSALAGCDRLVSEPLVIEIFDVNVGMDRLSKRKFAKVCHEKVVRIPLEGDEILRVHGERTQGVVKTLKNAKFRIDLVPEATSVAKSRYRLAPLEMQELSEQLRELQDKVDDALKERMKPRRVRAVAMTIQYGVRGMILAVQSEAFKQENVLAERLHGLESSLTGLELVQETTDKVVLIKEKLKAARDRPKELCWIGLVADRLRLPEELSCVHDTFHVSNLEKKCLADASLHVPLDEIKVDKTLRFVEEPVENSDREVKRLKCSRMVVVKFLFDELRDRVINDIVTQLKVFDESPRWQARFM
ncbi:hypothetical protein Tco_0533363 [Tanacetum coccineum]